MFILMILASFVIAVIVSVLSSCYVCYNVAVDPKESPQNTLFTVTGIMLLNVLVPFTLGSLTMLWHLT